MKVNSAYQWWTQATIGEEFTLMFSTHYLANEIAATRIPSGAIPVCDLWHSYGTLPGKPRLIARPGGEE
jgi:hypothetical protein